MMITLIDRKEHKSRTSNLSHQGTPLFYGLPEIKKLFEKITTDETCYGISVSAPWTSTMTKWRL